MQNNWKKYKVGDFAKRSKIPTKVVDSSLYKRLTIKMHGLGIFMRDEVKGEVIGTKNQFIAIGGQFLLSKIDARNGAFGILSDDLGGSLISNSFQAYDLKKNIIDIEYFNYFTKTYSFIDFCNKASEGTTNRRNLDDNKFLSFEVFLPPISEQKRIVKKINEISERVKKILLLQNYDTGAIIRSFSNNYFSSAFEEKTFKDIFKVTKLAGFEYTKHFKFIDKPEIIALRAQNIKNSGLKLNEVKYISKELSNFLVRSKLNKNDIAITFIGAGTGEAALIDENNKYHCAPNIAKLTVINQKEIDHNFALAQIRSPFVQDQIVGITRQTAQPSLSMKIIRKLIFKIPPKYKQNEYMSKLDDFKKSINALTLEKEKRNNYITDLMPSVLVKAFSGAL